MAGRTSLGEGGEVNSACDKARTNTIVLENLQCCMAIDEEYCDEPGVLIILGRC